MESSFKEIISKDITVNSSIYKLILKSSSDSIRFELYDKSLPVGISYQNTLNTKKLQEINQFFNSLNSIERVIKFFKTQLDRNKLNIKQNDSKIQIFFINPADEDETIYIDLNKIQEDNDSTINKLIQIIKDMKEELKVLKEQTIQSLIDDNKTMNEQIKELMKEIKILKEKDIIISNLDKESIIVQKKDDIDLINSWIRHSFYCKKIKYKKLYRAREDGDKASDFHKLCDQKGPTLTIGKTRKGYIFGGFTMMPWSSNGNYATDVNAFVFSLNQKKYFRTQDATNSIACQSQYGPKFGSGHAIEITDNCLSSNQNLSGENTSYGSNLGLTEGQYFSLDELEVLLIEFD